MSFADPEQQVPTIRSIGAAKNWLEFRPLIDVRILALVVVALMALRLPFAVIVPPNSDEAFYWLWGQHLQWSYRDHGPLVGWAMGAASALFGWSILALRLSTLVATAATLWIFWAWAGQLAPSRRVEYFWVVSAIYVCSPLMGIVSTNAYPDHLLVPLLMLALHFLCIFLFDWHQGRQAFRPLFAGAVFLGLAGLAKYNAVFLGVALAAAILADPKLRTLLRRPQLYMAAAACLLVASPVLLWNWAYGFPTVALHAVERYHGPGGFSLGGLGQIASSLLALSPFLLWPLWRFLTDRTADRLLRELRLVGTWSFLLSTGFMLALVSWGAATREFDIHWNVVAYVPFIIAAPLFIQRRWMLIGHLALGGIAVLVLGLVALTSPLGEHAMGTKPRDASRYGLDIVAAEMVREGEARHADFFAAPNWLLASRAAFAVGPGKIVTSTSADDDQFDLWFPGSGLEGKSAIVVVQGRAPEQFPTLPFDHVELLGTVTATRFDLPVADYALYLGQGYRPAPSRFDPPAH